MPLPPRSFFDALAAMGARRRTDPLVWLLVWCAESGLDPAARNPSSNAVGLNQMMPSTLKAYGYTRGWESFGKLSAEDQLPWIEQLIATGERVNGGPFATPQRYYHFNFYPATMRRGSADSVIVAASDADTQSERAAYAANKGLDADGSGEITVGDLRAALDAQKSRCAAAQKALAASVASFDSLGNNAGAAAAWSLSLIVAALAAWRMS